MQQIAAAQSACVLRASTENGRKGGRDCFQGGVWTWKKAGTHLDVGCAGNGDDVWALRKQPRERDLACRRAVSLANLREPGRELEDVREVRVRVARDLAPEVVRVEVIWRFLCAKEGIYERGDSGGVKSARVRRGGEKKGVDVRIAR